MLLVYLPDTVLPAHCRVPRSLGSPPEMLAGHPQSPAPQQGQGTNSASSWTILGQALWVLSLRQQRGAQHHCHMVCKKKLNNLCEVCKKNSEIRHIITLLQF